MKAFLKGMQGGVTPFFVLLFSVLSPEFLHARAAVSEADSDHSPVQTVTHQKESENFDDPHIKEKMQRSEEIVNEAVAHFETVSLAKGCRDFETDRTWKRGELEIFVFGERGECYLHGNDAHDIWKTFGKKAVAKKDDAKDFITAGADVLISPFFDKEVARVAKEKSVLWIPGCMTPTEIHHAVDAGCSIVKLFPGNVLKPDFVVAVKPLFSKTQFIITGGVEPDANNIKTWLEAGALATGLGSKLITKQILEKGLYEELQLQTTKLLESLQ